MVRHRLTSGYGWRISAQEAPARECSNLDRDQMLLDESIFYGKPKGALVETGALGSLH